MCGDSREDLVGVRVGHRLRACHCRRLRWRCFVTVEDFVHVRIEFLFWQVYCRVREIQGELVAGVERRRTSLLASAVLPCHGGLELAAPAHLI
jgi:hypothetical protein